uniref:NHS actin remodeling regulator n=1 Tax=Cynoglossus semilaevis TaxID=244447 RepID=A0A3P8VBS3_CYNSE
LDNKRELSRLDIECKVKSHYQITYHHPKKIFQPSSRPTCVDELYRQASLKFCHLLFHFVTSFILNIHDQFCHLFLSFLQLESIDTFFPTKCCRFSPWSKKDALSDSDTDGVALGLCSKFPIPNTPSTLDKQTNWTKALPLPTPAERMKSNSQVIISSVIPINVTGLTFDRDATLHCSVINSKPMLQRRRTLRRRKMDTCHLQDFGRLPPTALGSSSTCPSQTSETVPPAASSSLTSSCQSDSELSLISPTHANDDSADLVLDHCPDPRAQRSGSFSSTVTDVLESAGIETAVEQEWSNSHVGHSRSERLSPDKVENILACSSFTSIVTCESSLSDKTPSEKADTVSHCSVDTEGYYTSMHFDCGLRRSASYVYSDCTPSGSDFVLSDVGYSKTLGRSCLFLRKSKIKPYPPKRISSLTTICNLENHPDENEAKHFLPFLSAKEEKPRLVSTSTTGQSEYSFLCRGPSAMRQWLLPDDPFESAVLSFSGQFKDKGIMQTSVSQSGLQFSDSSQPSLNSSEDKTVDEHIRYQMTLVCQCDTAASPSPTDDEFKAISPTTPTTITSPSCGYSSDYPTHTSSFPLSFAPAPLSPPNGKSKPNVPERMSSLSSQSLQWQSIKKKDKTTTSDDGNTIMEYRKGIEMNTQNKQNIPNSCKVFSSTGIPVTLDSVMQRSLTDKCEKEMLTCASASHLHFVSLDELGKALVSPVERFGQTRCEEDELESFEMYSLLSETAADIGEDSLRQTEVTCEESKTLKKQDACSTSAPLLSSDPIEGSAAESKSEWVLMNKNNIEDDSEEDKHESSDGYAMKALEIRNGSHPYCMLTDSPSPESDAVSPLRDLSGTDDPPLSKIHSTEDLFTIIHRSKRKVLGPRDFNKLPATCPAFASGSRAITSNMNGAARSLLPKMSSSSVTLPSLQKVPVPIYRNVKKSSTSKEDFKQLLLKKGSCSNSNYRMSATDILKSPVVHKSQKDVLSESPFLLQQPEEQSISPLQQNSGQIDFLPRANADGYFPRSSPVFFSSGQGRSRILPPANSRHSARSRPYLALMQVISEGETENSDGSPHEENPSQGYS